MLGSAIGRSDSSYAIAEAYPEGGSVPQSRFRAAANRNEIAQADPEAVSSHSFVTDQSGIPLTILTGIPEGMPKGWRVKVYSCVKRILDIATAVGLIVVFAPVMIGIAVAIMIDSPGSVLFCQAREGRGRGIFQIYKFRTMYVDRQDVTGIRGVVDGDPRVTPLGKFLRRTSLDELPQLLNILRGDMSFVGPRPHVPGMLVSEVRYEKLVSYYHCRHGVRPGLTGWAQAHGFRGPAVLGSGAIERIEHDVAYIQNFSFWLDLKIAIQTVRREFITGSGL